MTSPQGLYPRPQTLRSSLRACEHFPFRFPLPSFSAICPTYYLRSLFSRILFSTVLYKFWTSTFILIFIHFIYIILMHIHSSMYTNINAQVDIVMNNFCYIMYNNEEIWRYIYIYIYMKIYCFNFNFPNIFRFLNRPLSLPLLSAQKRSGYESREWTVYCLFESCVKYFAWSIIKYFHEIMIFNILFTVCS